LRRHPALAAVALVLAVAAAGCGSSAAGAPAIKPLTLPALGPQLLDLRVQPETVKKLDAQKQSFVEAVGMFSLRKDTLLEATLQVSRFTPKARLNDLRFRNEVVSQIGSTAPQEFRMGDYRVYLTTGRRQSIAVWFRDRYLFILSTRDDYQQPLSLMRAALAVKP
jgi:hypothetical protein